MRELKLCIVEESPGVVRLHCDFTTDVDSTESERNAAANIGRMIKRLLEPGASAIGWGKTQNDATLAYDINLAIRKAGK